MPSVAQGKVGVASCRKWVWSGLREPRLCWFQTLEAVVQMFLDQLNPSAAAEVLERTLSLSPSPSPLPPPTLLTRLCQELESAGATDSILSIVKAFLRAKKVVRGQR